MDPFEEAGDSQEGHNVPLPKAPSSKDSSRNDVKDNSLIVEISDSMSERDKVVFTVHTKTTLSTFLKNEYTVTRQHEDFVWLHGEFEDCEEYAGIMIPPCPPSPDFRPSRAKLEKLSSDEGQLTQEEYQKLKVELEAEYLAEFKKTVAMHEVFLQRISVHPILRNDLNFKVFLDYDQNLTVRTKNKKEKVVNLFKAVSQQAEETFLLNSLKDDDETIRTEKIFLVQYYNRLKDATSKSDRMTAAHKSLADSCIKLSSAFSQLATIESKDMSRFFTRISEFYERLRKIEGRISSDEDLKLSDTFRYYTNDSAAAKSLLFRRSKALAEYDAANKNLEKARAKNKEVNICEERQDRAYHRFNRISDSAKEDLDNFKHRRITYFKKNLKELSDLEIKHAKEEIKLLKSVLTVLQS